MHNLVHHARQRVRIHYEKGESIKFISHQDEFRLWERALRRAGLPLLYKQGFNPQPHIQFASPLAVGTTGIREPIDITLCPPLSLAVLEKRIQAALPPGVTLHALAEVPLKAPALQSLLIGADYTILIYAKAGEIAEEFLQTRIEDFLSMDEIWRERERKGRLYRYNLRPLVFELSYTGYVQAREEHCISLRVQQRSGATGRPDEVVAALGFDDYARTLRRERLYLASEAADVALFASYPAVSQEQIATSPVETRRRRRRRRNQRSPEPRTISERAADEFD
jgi:radical SAM-linked protein